MKYRDGTKISLLDEVQLESGKRGVVVGFDRVNDRDYVEVRLTEQVGKLFVSTNAIEKCRTLKVKPE